MEKIEWFQYLSMIALIVGGGFTLFRSFKDDLKTLGENISREISSLRTEIKTDITRHDEELREMRQEFKDMRQEFSRIHALWADLLNKIHEIKLDQAKLSKKA